MKTKNKSREMAGKKIHLQGILTLWSQSKISTPYRCTKEFNIQFHLQLNSDTK